MAVGFDRISQPYVNEYSYLRALPLFLCILLLYSIMVKPVSAQSSNSEQVVTGPTGQKYKTVQIGEQIWMEENLNTDRFVNGDLIQEARTPKQWQKARNDSIPAWSYYNNNPENGVYYGKLYNWHAVSDLRGICPEGWRVPKEADRKILMVYLGMKPKTFDTFGWRGDIAPALISKRTAPDPHPRWDAPNEMATNSSGFTALPGGYRVGNPNYEQQQENLFRYIGKEAAFWSGENQIGWGVWTDRTDIFKGGSNLTDGFGFSVRCIQN